MKDCGLKLARVAPVSTNWREIVVICATSNSCCSVNKPFLAITPLFGVHSTAQRHDIELRNVSNFLKLQPWFG